MLAPNFTRAAGKAASRGVLEPNKLRNVQLQKQKVIKRLRI